MNEGLCQHLHVGYWRLNNGANIYTVVTFFVNGGYCLIHEFEPQTVICDGGGVNYRSNLRYLIYEYSHWIIAIFAIFLCFGG